MPKRTDIKTILIIGSGPIVIGQGCEFDYSGTQACKALREEGYQIVLVNSNPATIMTDPQFSDRTYIEPISPEAISKIIEKEYGGSHQIDALLPTLGGQTALNCACQLCDSGVLKQFEVEMIGATREVIYRAEDRQRFKQIMESIGLQMPRAGTARSIEQAWQILDDVGLPAIIRPAFTLGGTGGGIAFNREEFEDVIRRGLDASMTHEVLIDQSALGWKEYELEVMRDRDDNVVIVCSIENLDPMGVHTGDSITVAPAQTLTDKEYQRMRDAAMAVIRAIGVETGGSNIQFAINPADGQMVVIEMNPRVSRSSALASKATGFPIAKIAAKLAVGYTLWELPNDITGQTVACFEPTIDYVVVKIPRWTFEKFPEADETLTTQMKSVGEAMSIGRTFKEALQKGVRSMEVKRFGLGLDQQDKWLSALRHTLDWLGREDRAALTSIQAQSTLTPLQIACWMFEDTDGIASLVPSVGVALRHCKQRVRAVTGMASLHEAEGSEGNGSRLDVEWPIGVEKLRRKLSVPCQGRLFYVRYALKMGWTVQQVHEVTSIDPWFVDQIKQLVDFEQVLIRYEKLEDLPREVLLAAKQVGYSDAQLANLYLGDIDNQAILQVRQHRQDLGVATIYKLVDTCAAEFEAATPYFYSTYEAPITRLGASTGSGGTHRLPDTRTSTDGPAQFYDDESRVSDKKKIVILGGGPNRIGQGIEFDYCCVQAAFAAKELGFEAVMINSNPETVSTDYDTSDLLFFEPLTLEDVLNICEKLNGRSLYEPGGYLYGVIVQFGGQTPLNLAHGLEAAGVPIIGTSVDSIDLAEDRDRFQGLLRRLGMRQPENGIAHSLQEAIAVAERIGYPVLLRPSYVLGGRGMETCFTPEQLLYYMKSAVDVSDLARRPILIDKFLADAIEVDVDVVADYDLATSEPAHQEPEIRSLVCGVMEHIEEAGVHSGDSACAIPSYSLSAQTVNRIKDHARRLAASLHVCGLMNVQCAIKRSDSDPPGPTGRATDLCDDDEDAIEIYILEVNPRASRTVPYVSKAMGVSWAQIAAKIMAGLTLSEIGVTTEPIPTHTSVKESVFPFNKLPGVDVILGPEMRSTGEVMGIDRRFPIAFAKAQMAVGTSLPTEGMVLLSVRDRDKPNIVDVAQRLLDMGFVVMSTVGTHRYLAARNVKTKCVKKIEEGRPNVVDLIKNGELALLLNTPVRKGAQSDEGRLRSLAVRFNVPRVTTITGIDATVQAIEALRKGKWTVCALQDYFPADTTKAIAVGHGTG